jgi:hypothetical protein
MAERIVRKRLVICVVGTWYTADGTKPKRAFTPKSNDFGSLTNVVEDYVAFAHIGGHFDWLMSHLNVQFDV